MTVREAQPAPADASPAVTGVSTRRNAYDRIQAHEHHLNSMQTDVRKLASVWLLAALGAVAFLVRSDVTAGAIGAKLDARFLIVVVSFMANGGLFVVWVLDQLVYHRLLNSVFLLGLRMEYSDRSLPPIRTLMMLYSRRRGMARYLRWYYVGPMIAFGLLAAVAAVWSVAVAEGSDFTPTEALALSLASAAVALPVIVAVISGSAEKYHEIAAGFGDEEFVEYLRSGRFEDVLADH